MLEIISHFLISLGPGSQIWGKKKNSGKMSLLILINLSWKLLTNMSKDGYSLDKSSQRWLELYILPLPGSSHPDSKY